MTSKRIIAKLSECVEFGKIDKSSPYPPQMRSRRERTLLVGNSRGSIPEILLRVDARHGTGRDQISENKVFVPQVLMSAKAMKAAMEHLKPFLFRER